MGGFGAAHGCGGGGGAKKFPSPKICHTYPTMMKIGTQRRFKKYIKYVTHYLSSADISIFHRKSANFTISRNTDTDCILKHNF